TYGMNEKAVVADISEDGEFLLDNVAHPLIARDKVVRNTYRLSTAYQGIVISGSNTGGKTVGLKVIGLSIVSSYLGIPVIAEDAKIPLYDCVYVDIDDNQSIADSLSTFSAHITNINRILSKASADSFILIDELISGTDPKEAQAISLAIIDRIKEIGSRFVITTHFDDIKNYSYNDETILLSAVSFDMDELRPTYHYIEDSVGSSNALEIASRYFDDPSIIEKAREYLKREKTEEDSLMKKLEEEVAVYQKKNEVLKKTEEENRQLKKELEDKLKSFENEKTLLREKYRQELEEYVRKISEEAREKLNSLKTKEDKKVVKEIEELVSYEEVPKETEEVPEVGDNVRINDNEQIGVLEEIRGDRAVVNVRGIKVRTTLNSLRKMPKTKTAKVYQEKVRRASVSREINVIGKRVEEALEEIEPYLDSAYAYGLSSVKIIHGIGTGALRDGIRRRLRQIKIVAKAENGDYHDGGSAVTIVEFKK
ncbi:MAG: Smr/MutS family protein, partial [Erysipelotrichaceae bacterium]|nr:Smr/MutS family protein [Erysipelotrichaceae bacterium]